MAHIKYSKTKKGVLVARIQVSGKDPETGAFKIYPKNIQNDEGLSEAKFKKRINIIAAEYEQEVADAYNNKMAFIHTGVLTFIQLAEEWIATIDTNLSQGYYLRAVYVTNRFNEYLKTINLDKKPISEINVRDVQLYINSFSKGYIKGQPVAKLIRTLPDTVNFRELEREGIITRCASYGMNNKGNNIHLSVAEEICAKYKLKFKDYFEDVTVQKSYSIETIKGHRRILRTLFNEAIRYEWMAKNPVCATKIGAIKGNMTIRHVGEKEVYSCKEAQEFLTLLSSLPYEYINQQVPIKIMLLCGLRSAEVCGLRWSDIDLTNKLINVNRNRLVGKNGIYEKEPKTKTSKRSVPIPKSLVSDLEKLYKWFEEADVNFGTRLDQYYVASNIYRTPIYPHSLGQWLKALQKKYKIKRVTNHGLRHTYCSILLSKNVPIQTVSKYMGHSDSTVTLQVYSHFIPDTQEKALNVLDDLS